MSARPLGPRFWLRLPATVTALLAGTAFLLGSWFYWRLKDSLPVLDGNIRLPGLAMPARIDRDRLGVPTVQAANAVDAAQVLGYAHGQDRFFQMDLARRRAAGELSALVGSATIPLDRRAKVHDFRALARQALERATPEQRAILAAYAAGVNAGLRSLAVKPFEYIVLRSRPEPWRSEDSFLVCYSMTLTLQDPDASYLRALNAMRAVFGRQAAEFFSPQVGPADAALDGSTAPLPPIPGPEVINLRSDAVAAAESQWKDWPSSWKRRPAASTPLSALSPETAVGSNSMALAGRNGAPALVASDMHLELGLPNTWYRARLQWPGHDLTGVTLPGVPALVAGSNGQIAWALTNSYAGTQDLIAVESDIPDFYLGPGGAELPFRTHEATIHVRGHADARATSQWTIWGPVLGPDPAKSTRRLVLRWTEDDPAATNLNLIELANATTTDEALEIARRSGVPAVNFVVGDEHGRIGWTIAGRLPERVGYDGTARWPVSWQFGDRGWKGLLAPSAVPVVTGRDRLSTANQRLLGGDALKLLGDNGYFRGARGAQLASDLAALPRNASPKDLLAIQLDDRAEFLRWWRNFILELERSDPNAPARAAFYEAVRHDSGRAAVDSVGYRLVREFRSHLAEAVLSPLAAKVQEIDPDFDAARLNFEPALRAILEARPLNLLAPNWRSWDDLLQHELARAAGDVRTPWGRRNTLHVTHPLGRLLPFVLARWLSLEPVELPGDRDMPRVQARDFGASERFVVRPGRESEGIFEMPGGQSGHPLSPYYRAGTAAWEKGEPTPFLPGPPVHVLLMAP